MSGYEGRRVPAGFRVGVPVGETGVKSLMEAEETFCGLRVWIFRPGNGSPSATNVVLVALLVIRFSIP